MATGDKLVNLDDLKAVYDASNALILPKNLAQGVAFTTGKIVKPEDGQTRNSSYFRCTGYIDVSGSTSIVYSRIMYPYAQSSSSWSMGIAFYDSSKNFIADSGEKVGYNAPYYTYKMHTVAVPTGATYMRATWFPANATDYYKANNFMVFDADDYANTMMDILNSTRTETTALQTSIATRDKMVATYDRASGSYVVVDGVLYKATEAITTGQTISEHATAVKVTNIIADLESRIAALEAANT